MQPSFAEMVAHVERRAGPRSDELEEFALTEEGHQAAERLRRQNTSFETLYESVAQLRSRWDLRSLDELVERVYEQYPEYAEKSLIREEVAERAEKRKRDR